MATKKERDEIKEVQIDIAEIKTFNIKVVEPSLAKILDKLDNTYTKEEIDKQLENTISRKEGYVALGTVSFLITIATFVLNFWEKMKGF